MRTLVAFLLLSLCGVSSAQTPTKDEVIVQQLKEIQKTLEEMREANKKDISDLDSRLKKLEEARTVAPFTDKAKGGRVEEEDDRPARRRIEVNRTFDPPDITYGSVRIKNSYALPVTFYVNGAPYRVPVGSTRVVDYVPSGTFTYSVAEVNGGKSVTRNLKSDETFDLTVYTVPETVNYPVYYAGYGGGCSQP